MDFDNTDHPKLCPRYFFCPKVSKTGRPKQDFHEEESVKEAANQEDGELDPDQKYIEDQMAEHDSEIRFTQWCFDEDTQTWVLACTMIGGFCLTHSQDIDACILEFFCDSDPHGFVPKEHLLSVLTGYDFPFLNL